ncbi:MAG: ACP S-malonyltransferase [Deltaproteobacteria bacterium]|nr:ACP S-malonyltransferase [Deltaproteobacteria bacterium]
MKRVGIVFPGQGSQYVGMGKSIYDSDPHVKKLFDKADQVLGFSIKKLCFEGPEDELRKTYNTQPAILLVSYAIWEKLKQLVELKPYVVAGHSLGEYTALLVSGFFSFEEALYIVRKRGILMENAYPEGKGGMVALLSPDIEMVKSALDEVSQEEGLASLANLNSPDQIVLSGDIPVLKKVVEKLKGKGYKKAIFLNVSGPFHSPLMKRAADQLLEELRKIKSFQLKYPVVFNVDANVEIKPECVYEKLYYQMFSPVRWEDCVKRMVAEGVEVFVEVGPKNVLSNLIKKIMPGIPSYSVETQEDMINIKEILK